MAHSDPAHALLKREVLASKSVDDLTTNCGTTAAIIVIARSLVTPGLTSIDPYITAAFCDAHALLIHPVDTQAARWLPPHVLG